MMNEEVIVDFYLDENNVYNRLRHEFETYGRLIIAVDFDDTLYNYHKIEGRTYDMVIDLLRKWKDHAEIIVYSCIEPDGKDRMEFVKKYLKDNDIPYHKFNEQSCRSPTPNSRKVYYNILLDDRAGLKECFDVLKRLYLELVRDKEGAK